MKKFLSILLAFALCAAMLAACGQKEAEIQYELDPAHPLPADSGAKVTDQTFAELCLTLGLPSGFAAEVRQEEDAYGEQHPVLYVTKEGKAWQITLEPMLPQMHSLYNTNHNLSGNDNLYEYFSTCESTFQGMKANYYAKCIKDGNIGATSWAYPSYDIVVNYGDTAVGQYIGLHVTLTSSEQANIYELMNEKDLAAFFNHITIIEGDSGQTLTAGGITVTVPSAWTGSETSALGPTAGFPPTYEIAGSVSVTSEYGSDPQQKAEAKGEVTTVTYGGKDYYAVKTIGDQYSYLYLFSEFNEERYLCVTLQMVTSDEAALDEFADGDTFRAIVESIEFDPDGFFDTATKDREGDWIVGKAGELAEYTGSDAAVEIPDTISGRPVTVILSEVFKDNENIVSVVIPEGVTKISSSAFENCVNLESVTFPSTLETITQNAFRNCPKLKDVVLPAAIREIGDYAFYESGAGSFTAEGGAVYGMHALEGSGFDSISVGADSDLTAEAVFAKAQATEVTIGEGTTGLGKSAFSTAANVYELVLPDSMTVLGENSLAGMSGLRKLTLPNALERIEAHAMSGSSPFMVIIPETVTYIGTYGVDADTVFLMNGNGAELETDSLVCSYIYLNGIYDPSADIAFNVDALYVSQQIYLPADATLSESDGLDQFLLDMGWRDIAWISMDPEHYDPDYETYTQDGNFLTGYTGDKTELWIPEAGDSFGTWDQYSIRAISNRALAELGLTAVSFDQVNEWGSQILDGNPDLADIWFNGTIVLRGSDRFQPDTFQGVPETVTVHLPDSLTESERADVRSVLEGAGMPASATYEYYSFR